MLQGGLLGDNAKDPFGFTVENIEILEPSYFVTVRQFLEQLQFCTSIEAIDQLLKKYMLEDDLQILSSRGVAYTYPEIHLQLQQAQATNDANLLTQDLDLRSKLTQIFVQNGLKPQQAKQPEEKQQPIKQQPKPKQQAEKAQAPIVAEPPKPILHQQQMPLGPRSLLANNANGQNFLEVNGQRYEQITGGLNFSLLDKPVAQMGSSNTREAILLDPKSVKIKELYYRFMATIVHKQHGETEVLKAMIRFCKQVLSSDNIYPAINRWPGIHVKNAVGKYVKAVDLADIVADKTGVCRHHSTLAAYILGCMVQANQLSNFNIYMYRNNIKGNGAHQVVILTKPMAKDNNQIYCLDSLNTSRLLDLSKEYDRKYLANNYGEDFLNEIYLRYNTPEYVQGKNQSHLEFKAF